MMKICHPKRKNKNRFLNMFYCNFWQYANAQNSLSYTHTLTNTLIHTKAISGRRLLLLYCCEGQQWRSHCNSLQGLSPLLPWMTCLPTYLAGREVFGAGWGSTAKGAWMWLKSQESMRLVYHCSHVLFDCQTKRVQTLVLFSYVTVKCKSNTRLLSVMFS